MYNYLSGIKIELSAVRQIDSSLFLAVQFLSSRNVYAGSNASYTGSFTPFFSSLAYVGASYAYRLTHFKSGCPDCVHHSSRIANDRMLLAPEESHRIAGDQARNADVLHIFRLRDGQWWIMANDIECRADMLMMPSLQLERHASIAIVDE